MSKAVSYPMTITPLADVVSQSDRNGRAYLSFRAKVCASGRTTTRTVRAFGARVQEGLAVLRKGIPIAGRFSYDSFQGSAGEHSQTLRIVNLNN